MTAEFIDQDVWQRLSVASKKCTSPAFVAVAYFGIGAADLLPLPSGSRLVVDASQQAVKSGQTHPNDLLRLVEERQIRVFSVPNLHSKVYVFGDRVFVGSANVSFNSADRLVEALLLTSETRAVKKARQFVQGLCLQRLTPTLLKRLSKLYRPPKDFGDGTPRPRTRKNVEAAIPPVRLAQLSNVEWSEEEYAAHDKALELAKKRRRHRNSFKVDSFSWPFRMSFQPGETVLQITKEANGKTLISPPGTTIHTRAATPNLTGFVYVEVPSDLRRRRLEIVAKQLGIRGTKRLRRAGLVNKTLARKLLAIWEG